ncbi:multisubunit sodium/proton antiporter, MrpG subunit [Limimonas halophila]|uniref:Multisubunit sodium/proton antiporter, MrpG subunit n=1 Tax=Limimonas halophila TaxID=1082479 RepID=A0A1G7NST2_9PROT|nr:monovalent cation/H(+) antiporter subunit G [Limimonas halophila]SDF76977.1 multisubunit sodium/proton antiporter, MrpG subunit [Limimonas halophila]
MSLIAEILAGLAAMTGAVFVFSAALGLVRMPDVYLRMHAATKAGTLGSGLVLVGVAVWSGEPGVVLRALAAILFLIMTAPVAAHLLGRAAYISGVPLWRGTSIDELRGRYQGSEHRLRSRPRDNDDA